MDLEEIDRLAWTIAEEVSKDVLFAHYSRENISRVAHRSTYLRVYLRLALLEAETTGRKFSPEDMREVAKRYDARREADEREGWRKAYESAMAKRKEAIGD